MISIDEIHYELSRAGLNVRPLFVDHDLAVDPGAEGPNGATPLFFIPDLHLLSQDRAGGYGDFFNLNPREEKILIAFLRRLLELRDKEKTFPRLAVYQLGDLHDLWREQEHWWWHENLGEMLDRQVETHGDLFALLGSLAATRLVGNHDDRLRDKKEQSRLAHHPIAKDLPVERLVPEGLSLPWGEQTRVELFHADRIDPIETGFFSFLNPVGARMAAEFGATDEWHYELLPAGTPDPSSEPAPLPESILDFEKPLADKREDEALRQHYFEESLAYTSELTTLPDRAPLAVVIGHTHAPRIVVRGPSPPHTLVDCGSWVNRSSGNRKEDPFWNGQVGVLSGCQVALFQVGL